MKAFHRLLAILLIVAPSVKAQNVPSWEFQGRENFVDELAETLVKDKMVILGEVHGTNESQQIVAELLQRVTGKRPVLLALELPEDSQPALDAFLTSSGTRADIESLLENHFWSGFSDGRNSLAMLRLLDQVRDLIKAGADVHLIGMDPTPGDSAKERDAGMARLIEAAASRKGGATTIVLVGNAHSRPLSEDEVKAGQSNLVSGLKLPARVVNLGAARGSMWVCTVEGCGVRTIKTPRPDVGLDTAVVESRRTVGRHDFRVLRLPQFTPSFPATMLFPAEPRSYNDAKP